MELWRADEGPAERPKVLDARSIGISLAIHAAFFLACILFASFHARRDEVITPIDLTVVVEENLDGNPDEPPPLQKPEDPPPPPPPKPKPKPKEPEKPKELERIVTNIVTKVDRKEPEKPAPKQPEPPKKTAKELRDERIRRMREKARDTKQKVPAPRPPQPNGRTGPKTLSDAEIRKLLNMGYRPGSSTNLAAGETQRYLSMIKMAFEDKWNVPPWTDRLKPMTLRVWFGNGGRILRYRLVSGSGDGSVDATIKSAASRVSAVRGLSADFIDVTRDDGVDIVFEVKPK